MGGKRKERQRAQHLYGVGIGEKVKLWLGSRHPQLTPMVGVPNVCPTCRVLLHCSFQHCLLWAGASI